MDQGCCGWEQREAEVGGSAVCREHLSSAQHSGFGAVGFIQPFIPTEALAEDVLPPGASWFLAVQHGAHVVPLCRSVLCFFLGLAALFGRAQSLAKITRTKSEIQTHKAK